MRTFKNSNLNAAKNYIKSRNLTANDVKNFKIGFVTNNQNFYQELLNKFKDKDLKESGLFILMKKIKSMSKGLEEE